MSSVDEMVSVTDLTIGDYVRSFGSGYMTRRVTDIKFEHAFGDSATPRVNMVLGEGEGQVGHYYSLDTKVCRSARNPIPVAIPATIDGLPGYRMVINGQTVREWRIVANMSAWEYIRNHNGPLDTAPKGYVFMSGHDTGADRCTKSTSLKEIVRIALHDFAHYGV